MTPYEYERFMAEAIPTGRFGRPDVDSHACQEVTSTPRQQAARRAALDEAQRGWLLPDVRSRRDRARKRASRPRHLHLVPDSTAAQAA